MKKFIFVTLLATLLSACTQGKDIYFNGSEGSHSGLKLDKETRTWGLNK